MTFIFHLIHVIYSEKKERKKLIVSHTHTPLCEKTTHKASEHAKHAHSVRKQHTRPQSMLNTLIV